MSGGAGSAAPPAPIPTPTTPVEQRVLVLPGQGHSVMGVGCAPDVVERFVSSASFAKLDAECLQRERATPFFLGYAGAAP
jgi:hypothetical protein